MYVDNNTLNEIAYKSVNDDLSWKTTKLMRMFNENSNDSFIYEITQNENKTEFLYFCGIKFKKLMRNIERSPHRRVIRVN